MPNSTTHMVQLLNPILASPPSSQIHPLFSVRITNIWRCSYSNPQKPIRTHNFNFNFDDDIFNDESLDQNEAFSSKSSSAQKRIWWSDANFFDDIHDEDEFPVFEDSIGVFSWIPKVFRAFGWMVPAIFISMLLGTGPNAFFMALALPLAQSALSLVVNTLWNNLNDNPRPKPRTKRRSYYARAASNVATRKEKVENTANEAKAPKGERKKPNFGGWDELDKQVRSEKVPLMAQIRKVNEQSRQKKGKLSRRVTKREKPLVLRLLIAIFPFLGSWTKLL